MNKYIAHTVYAVIVNNFGVASGSFASCAIYKSADTFPEFSPGESMEMKEQIYVDDELVASLDEVSIRIKAKMLDEIRDHTGMLNKGWTYSGDTGLDVFIGEDVYLEEKVFSIRWNQPFDDFRFKVTI